MGISIRDWIVSKLSPAPVKGCGDITCTELWEAVQEYRPKDMQSLTGKTAFLHKLIYKLYSDNEALVIATKHRSGAEMLVVADSFEPPQVYPAKMNEYKGVVVGEVSYQKTFRENEVLHFRLNAVNVKPVLEAMTQSFNSMLALAIKNYSWGSGKHMKVHINQTEQNDPEFAQRFREMINEQIKPFFDSDSALLPEFDGYDYSEFPANATGTAASRTTRDIRYLADDIFDFTARAFQIPPVLLFGDVAGTQDAMTRWLTTCIDPLCDQIQEDLICSRTPPMWRS